jgi:predicted DNA-binding protein
MSSVINARLPHRVEQKLADYCAKQGVTKSEAVVRALDRYLNEQAGSVDAYSLAVDLIPAQGIPALQSDNVRALAQRAFRASRAR